MSAACYSLSCFCVGCAYAASTYGTYRPVRSRPAGRELEHQARRARKPPNVCCMLVMKTITSQQGGMIKSDRNKCKSWLLQAAVQSSKSPCTFAALTPTPLDHEFIITYAAVEAGETVEGWFAAAQRECSATMHKRTCEGLTRFRRDDLSTSINSAICDRLGQACTLELKVSEQSARDIQALGAIETWPNDALCAAASVPAAEEKVASLASTGSHESQHLAHVARPASSDSNEEEDEAESSNYAGAR
ncbi:hypothetical protein IE81DRAFT_341050 [Ceraceosorus guamensis]|uniref:Uncharacterized protein n=1 Tax=Ceraceosorus guamensis TaxID=1522189 RepID=A0A316W2I6_9BASI|nr:hypothetical protein IE81DRAFT_341050 [Ceraceosorus guamensis]PWN42993.1 hypothetical protein IE81DRAFT_341050 [Ceraceosorus guamensis]